MSSHPRIDGLAMDEGMNGSFLSTSQLTDSANQMSDQATHQQQHVDVNMIIDLVNTMYNSANPDDQNEANRRLTELQSSPSAWHVCWLLLDPNQNYPIEVHFFAANLLVQKINQNWSQQDDEWLEGQLRPKLFETLVNYAASPNGTKLVIERLALALANFALHSIPSFWLDAIEEIVHSLTSSNLSATIPQQRLCDILLKILAYIPEEYSVMLPNQKDRSTLTGQITKSGPIVFNFLRTILLSDKRVTTVECKQDALKCLTSWITHSQASLLDLDDGKSLLYTVYGLLVDEELCGPACVVLGATFDSRKCENFKNSIIEFMPKLADLKPIIDRYINMEDDECIIKIYSLVINFCENHSKLMIKIVLDENVVTNSAIRDVAKQSVFTLIRMILDCTAAQGIFGIDEKCSEITFPFWFSFLEVFYYYIDAHEDAICDLFDPLVDSLLEILIKKAQYPPTFTYHQVWDDDQREEYRRYRHDLGDVLSLVVQFPRAKQRILERLFESLGQELKTYVRAAQSQNVISNSYDESSWQGLEAIIFALKCVAENVPYDEENYMPKIFDLLAQVSFGDCKAAELYCTATEMIAAYSDWLFTHTNHLAIAFKILFLGVTSPNPYVRLMSTMALKDITTECQQVLHQYSPSIIKSCTDAILSNGHHLDTMEKARLMHTFGCAVVMASPTIINESIANITSPILNDLTNQVHADVNSDSTSKTVINDRLHMINSLIGSLHVKQYSGNDYEDADENTIHQIYVAQRLNPNLEDSVGQPAIGLLRQLIPILGLIVEKYRSDEEIMGKVAETVKKAAKNLSIELKPILKDLMGLLVNAYDPLQNFTIIQDTIPLYNTFKVDPSARNFLRDAFASVTSKTLSYCLANPLRQLSVTVEVFFKFAHSVCKRYFDFIAEQPCHVDVDLLYKLAIASLELPEKRTLTEVCNFLMLFRMKCAAEPHLQAIFVSHMELMITNIFNIFGGNYSTPRNAIETISDMMFFMLDAPETVVHLKNIVERDNFPTCHVDRCQKDSFVSKIIQESARRNRKKFKESCSEFVLIARNLNRSV